MGEYFWLACEYFANFWETIEEPFPLVAPMFYII